MGRACASFSRSLRPAAQGVTEIKPGKFRKAAHEVKISGVHPVAGRPKKLTLKVRKDTEFSAPKKMCARRSVSADLSITIARSLRDLH